MRSVKDELGHEIYMTDERWNHICEEHPEMQECKSEVLEVLERGRRVQDSVRPDVYLIIETMITCPMAIRQLSSSFVLALLLWKQRTISY